LNLFLLSGTNFCGNGSLDPPHRQCVEEVPPMIEAKRPTDTHYVPPHSRPNANGSIANRISKSLLAFATLISACCCGCQFGAQRHNVAGNQAFEMGQITTAINEFQQAVNLNPKSADAFYNLGASYYSLGKQQKNSQWMQQAEQLYRQAISLNDQHADSHRGLAAVLIETGQEKFAFDLLNSWKERYPGATDPVIELARLYQEYGDNRRATDLLADALRLDGQNVRALKAMGHIRELQGQTHLALDNYLRVLQTDQNQSDVASRVASLQYSLAQAAGIGQANQPAPIQQPRYGSANPYQQR
jgi:tetratricopeptide (TPR) repeat protein